MRDPAKKPEGIVTDYLRNQGLAQVRQLADIHQGDFLAEVVGKGNTYCDLYLAVARSFNPHGDKGPEWDLTGKYAWVWVPDQQLGEPIHNITRSRRHEVTLEALGNAAYFIVPQDESPLAKIAAKLL